MGSSLAFKNVGLPLLLALLLMACILNTVHSQYSPAVNATITSTVSNPTIASYILNNPTAYSYFLLYPNQMVGIISNPAMAGIDNNPQQMIAFLGNPTLGTLLMNYSNFTSFTANPSFAVLVNNQGNLASLLSNPALTAIINNQSGFNSLISSQGFGIVSQNPTALVGSLSNPVISQISPSQLTAFVTNSQLSALINNPSQFSSIMSNPSLTMLISTPSFGTFVTSGAYSTLTQNPQFASMLSSPSFGAFIQNPSLPSIEGNPQQLSAMISNPALSQIISNPNQLASLLSNPSLATISANPSGLVTLTSQGNLAGIISNPSELSTLLSSPSLSAINSNPTAFASFAGTSQLSGIIGNPSAFASLLSNPSFPGVMSNPAGLGTVMSNPTLIPLLSNQQSLQALLGSPSLVNIAANPANFATIISTGQITSVISNPAQFSTLMNNPSFSTILGNPTQFGTFLSTQSLSPVVSNPTQFASLLSNPSLGTIMQNPAGLASVLSLPSLTGAASSNPLIITNLLSNPSLSGISSNPAQLDSFISGSTFTSITSDPNQLAGLMGNPSLTGILSNQNQLSSLLGTQSISLLQSGNPAAFASLLGNPSIVGIMGNPTQFNNMLGTAGLSPILNNPTQLASLLSNPSLNNIASNPTQLASLLGGPGASTFAGSSAFSGLLSNPALGGILGNPQSSSELSSLLNTPGLSSSALNSQGMSALMSNPTALQSFLSNPSLGSMESNPGSLNNFLGGDGLDGIMSGSDPGAALYNSELATTINNGAAADLLDNNGALGSTLSNTDLSGALSSGSLTQPGALDCASVGGGSAPPAGACAYRKTTTLITKFSTGLGYSIQKGTASSQSSKTPLVLDVQNKNWYSSQNLITCPLNPDVSYSQRYFTSSNLTFVAGNKCLASTYPLTTVITLTTIVAWSPLTPAFATQTYSIASIASGFTMPLAYSGETGTPTSQAYNLSNGYNTESYIFSQVPSSPQQGLWTWSAQYADLSQTNVAQLDTSSTIKGLQYGPLPLCKPAPPPVFCQPIMCTFNYDYSLTSNVDAINNTNVTVPIFNRTAFSGRQYLNVSGYMYAPITSASSSCSSQLLAGINCGGWTKISENATLAMGGTFYTGLNAYINKDGSGIIAAYPGGLEQVDPRAVDTVNVSAMPYILYNTTIPTAYTQLSSSVSFMNSSYNLYSTHNYMNPATSFEPFSLDTDSAFIGTYGGLLSLFPSNLTSLNYTFDTNSFAKSQTGLLTTMTKRQASSLSGAFSNQQTLGSFVYGSIQNPVFISTSPNGDVYVLKYTNDNCPNGILSFCIGSTTVSYLYRLHFIPEGYVNLSSNPPNKQQTQSNVDAWKNEWKSYYANATLQGSQDVYVANTYLLSSTVSSIWSGTYSNGGLLSKFVPLALSSDSSGDVFLLGAHTTGVLNTGGGGIGGTSDTDFTLVGLMSNGKTIGTEVKTPARSSSMPAFIPSAEFAASPNGQYVYVANASYGVGGTVLVYQTTSTGTSGSSALQVMVSGSGTITSGQSLTLTANPTGGTQPYTYQWYADSGCTVTMSGQTNPTMTDSPTTSNTYCVKVADSASPAASATATGTISTTTALQGTCPNQDYSSGSSALSFQTIVACAQQAGFSGTQLIQIVSIAYAESSGNPGVSAQGISSGSNCVAMGILQEGQCNGANGESYPLSNPSYDPNTCTPYQQNPTWTSIWDDPTCAFQWADDFVNQNPPITQSGCSQAAGDTPFCFWGSYWVNGNYCKYAPSSYSGYDCSSGLNQANLPWSSVGVASSTPTSSFFKGQLSGGFTYIGNISLSYSNATFNMNLVKYLQAGGPYSDPAVAQAYSAQTYNAQKDALINHHPVSIVDSRGILYVIDNWTFTVDGTHDSSVLMLRAFAQNGTEIPIDPSTVNTLSSVDNTAVAAVSSIGAGTTPQFGWKPYGWPLSASITLPSGQVISYCAVQCTNDPGSMHASNTPIFNSTAYDAIGPHIDTTSGAVGDAWNSISITSDFNGTLYIIAHPWSFTTTTSTCSTTGYILNIIGAILVGSAPGNSAAGVSRAAGSYCVSGTSYSVSKPSSALYTELLVLHPVIENYTKLDFAANTTYLCYLSVSPPAHSSCISDRNTQTYLPNLYPPLVGVPSSFEYAESLGGPEQYLNLQNAFSAIFPTLDTSKYSSGASSVASSGISGQPNYGSLASSTPSSSSGPKRNLPTTYLKSALNGYLLTPYKITLELDQKYSNIQAQQGDDQFCSVYATGATLLSLFGATSSTNTKYAYQTTQLGHSPVPYTSSPFLNSTIESGGTYAQFIPLQTNFIPNLSDAGLTISPYINFQILTNRIDGEIFINQTVNPKTVASSGAKKSGLPLVVNATNNYTYSELQFTQSPSGGIGSLGGGTFGYVVQIAQPLQNPIIGANCGSSCPSNYYYSNKYLNGPSNLTFNTTAPNPVPAFQLFELFKTARYLDSLVLNLTKADSGILGFNRFVYTYVDRFNNTVDMPLDVDLANITQLSLNDTIAINSLNTNETTVTVNGIAFYSTQTGTLPLPQGSPIYLYYDTNINYLNKSSSPTQNPTGYYKYSMLCAFAPSSKGCILANPLSTLTQPQPSGSEEANATAYHTDFGSSGSCSALPNSLLTLPTYNCNIYGNYSLPAVSQQSGQQGYQYCLPLFSNGTGVLTSQLGLLDVTKTDSSGKFNYSFTACGASQDRVTAYYYGSNAPEPVIAQLSPLSQSGGAAEFNPHNTLKYPEFNYTYSPNQTTAFFSIGNYSLSIGAIPIMGLLAAIGTALLIILMQIRNKPFRKRPDRKEETK
jgi:hypothetical protein